MIHHWKNKALRQSHLPHLLLNLDFSTCVHDSWYLSPSNNLCTHPSCPVHIWYISPRRLTHQDFLCLTWNSCQSLFSRAYCLRYRTSSGSVHVGEEDSAADVASSSSLGLFSTSTVVILEKNDNNELVHLLNRDSTISIKTGEDISCCCILSIWVQSDLDTRETSSKTLANALVLTSLPMGRTRTGTRRWSELSWS